jgi:uncharacterized protein (DUF885 family)
MPDAAEVTYLADMKQLVDDFLKNEFETSPVTATALGLTDYDERLDDMSEGAYRKRDADALEWMARFESVDPATLSVEDQIDRDLAIATLRGRTIAAVWLLWRGDP